MDNPFGPLDPFTVIQAVERRFALDLVPALEPFNSYVNRVYGLQGSLGERLVVKFYRPGRWSLQGLEDEHRFLFDLEAGDVPVVTPLQAPDGSTVQELLIPPGDDFPQESRLYFALFPRKAGRQFDAERPDDWTRLGALAGRMHRVGARASHRDRPSLGPLALGQTYLDELWNGEVVHRDLEQDFFDLAEGVFAALEEPFAAFAPQRIHGDFHRGNILDRPDTGLLAFDFDDTVHGPAMQDLWLLLPGRIDEGGGELDLILDEYSRWHHIDPRQVRLVEGLRFFRQIHYLVWQTRQVRDHDFFERNPSWGSKAWWIQELESLRTQADYALGTL